LSKNEPRILIKLFLYKKSVSPNAQHRSAPLATMKANRKQIRTAKSWVEVKFQWSKII